MFSTRLTRIAAHRTPCAASSLPASSPTTAAHRCTQSLAARGPSHQRRHSSSKPQSPSDSNKPAPSAKAAATEDASQAPASEQQRTRGKKTARYNRFMSERAMKAKADAADRFAGLPSVPGIPPMHEAEFRLCSFFSLHRPLSLSTTIPPPTTAEQFNSIFEAKPRHDSWENGNSAERRPEQVIYTLHDTIEALEQGANGAQEEGMTWETLQESSPRGGVKHLDGTPRMRTLEELVAFKHFQAPPPPQPFIAEAKSERQKARETKHSQPPKQKRYTATITFTESTYADGQRTFTASPSPIVPVVEEPTPRRTVSQPFLERMRKREQAGTEAARQKMVDRRVNGQAAIRRAPSSRRIKMMLISVKRQRKLKMKKHKYKKLMKRTRTLRRRQDRA